MTKLRDEWLRRVGVRISRAHHRGETLTSRNDGSSIDVRYYSEPGYLSITFTGTDKATLKAILDSLKKFAKEKKIKYAKNTSWKKGTLISGFIRTIRDRRKNFGKGTYHYIRVTFNK